MIFLPELPADSREKAVKAGTEQKNWVERMKESLYVQTYHDKNRTRGNYVRTEGNVYE